MTKIRFAQPDGAERVVEATDGLSAMRAATGNGVPGIVADCGGSLSCGTCHVYVAQGWLNRLPPPSDDEAAMLQIVLAPRPNSRLSCQIAISAALEGLLLEVPAAQL
jgi:ferredoxin, 2Fe-2S